MEAEEVLKFADQRDKRLQSGHIDHNIDSIGALIMPIPVIMHCANMNSSDAVKVLVHFNCFYEKTELAVCKLLTNHKDLWYKCKKRPGTSCLKGNSNFPLTRGTSVKRM